MMDSFPEAVICFKFQDRISVEGQIQLSVECQIYHFLYQINLFYLDCKQNRKLSEPLQISRKVLFPSLLIGAL